MEASKISTDLRIAKLMKRWSEDTLLSESAFRWLLSQVQPEIQECFFKRYEGENQP